MEYQGLEARITVNSHQHPAGPQWPLMRSLRNLKIGQKLSIGFGLLVMLTLVGATVSFIASRQATISINRTEDVRVPTALASTRAQKDLLKMLGDVRGYLALGESEFRDSYQQARRDFETDLATLKELSPQLNETNRARLIKLENTFEQWSALPDTLFALRDDQLEREPAYRLLATDGLRTGAWLLIDLQSMMEAQTGRNPSPENIKLLGDMARFQGSFTAMLSGLRGYVTTRNRIFLQEYEVNLEANEFEWDKLRHKKLQLTPPQQSLLANIAQTRTQFLELPPQMFEALESDRWREDLYLFRIEAVPLAAEMQTLLEQMTADQQILLETDLSQGRGDLSAANRRTLIAGTVAVLLGGLLAVFFRENIAGPVRRLTAVAEQIRAGQLEAQADIESADEIGTLAETFNNMTGQLRQTLWQVRKEKKRADDLLDVVIPIGVELASEKDFNRLLEGMLLEAKSFCRADAGILYLRGSDDRLEFVIIRNDSQNIALGGTVGEKIKPTGPFAPLPLCDTQGKPTHTTAAAHAAQTGQTVNLSTAEVETGLFSGYRAESSLTMPLKNSANEVIGALQLVNAHEAENGQIVSFDKNLQQMMESFSSLAVAALEAYIREQSLKQEIRQLRIEIDEVKRQQQVEEITETEFFQDLQIKAAQLRRRRGQTKEEE
jgi:CHASE3 domain sensor protein